MNKKIAGEFAVGVILLTAIIISGIFWFHGARQSRISSASFVSKHQAGGNNPADGSCKPRYFEGEAEIQGWLADNKDQNGTVIRIKDENKQDLPIINQKLLADPMLKLVDPTDDVKESLRNATREKPAIIVVHGYAEICQITPLVSLKKATIAFKKS